MYTKKNSLFKVKSTTFFNGLYFFKLGLFAFSLTNFSLFYNLVVFFLLAVHINKPIINRVWRLLIGSLAFILFYHDSYLPSLEQIMAQKDNLTNFSVDYILEFIKEFINIYMIIAFVVATIALKFINKYIRAFSIIVLLMLIMPFMNLDILRIGFSNDDVIRINENLFTKKVDKNSIFTQSNLNDFEEKFYESQEDLILEVPSIPENFSKFNIVLVHVDGLSNFDLSKLDLKDVSTLKRFDAYLTNFNTVSSESSTNIKRLLFNSLCGQKPYKDLEISTTSSCSLVGALKNLGYKTQFIFDDEIELAKQKQSIFQNEMVLLSDLDKLNSSIKEAFDSVQKFSSEPLFQYVHLNALTKEKNVANYKNKAISLLIRLGRLMDLIEKTKKPTLMIMLPSRGSFVFNDVTQPTGFGYIPSLRLTKASAMIKFFRSSGVNEIAIYEKPVSYMGLTELIFRVLENNSFSNSTVFSPKSLVEELTKNEYVNDNQTASFIEIKQKQFYKILDSKWTEYKE